MRQTEKTEKKDNRKSILLIALLLLLVAIIGFGGYTLSKYITSKSESGTAQVAKWGFTVDANGDKLFGKNYKFEENNSVVTTDAANLTVKASGAYNVVAPGTTGSMTFSVKGKAEVLAKLSIEMSNVQDITLKYTKGEDTTVQTYNPVKWTLKKGGANVEGAENVTLAVLAEKLKTTTIYEVGAAEVNDTYTIEWKWDFESADNQAEIDSLDTLLGMIANDGTVTENGDYKKAEGTIVSTTFKLDISIVQLQK